MPVGRATRCLLFGPGGFIGARVRTVLAATPDVELLVSARPAVPAERGARPAGRHRGSDPAGADPVRGEPADSDVDDGQGGDGDRGGAEPADAGATAAELAASGLATDLAVDGPATVARVIRAAAPDVVINCAGATYGDPATMVAGNVVAVATLVDAIRSAAPTARLVHLGSAAEYGRVTPGRPVTESVRPDPVGAYGITKLAGTALVGAAGLDAVVLRIFNLIGPGSPPTGLPGRLAGEFRRAAESGDGVRVGSLEAHRDFVDVRDVAAAVVAAALAPGALPPILNVGSGVATPLRELADALRTISGVDAPVHEVTAGSARSADVPWQCADPAAIGAALGWSATISVPDSLRDLWHGAACAV